MIPYDRVLLSAFSCLLDPRSLNFSHSHAATPLVLFGLLLLRAPEVFTLRSFVLVGLGERSHQLRATNDHLPVLSCVIEQFFFSREYFIDR